MNVRFLSTVVICGFFISLAPVVTQARPSSVAKRNLQLLLTTGSCPKCDLSGLDMTRLNLSRVNLEGADLSFSACNLANLSYANLRGATLYRTSMIGADLEGADLRNAALRETSLDSAFLGGAFLDETLRAREPAGRQRLYPEAVPSKRYAQPSSTVRRRAGEREREHIPCIRAERGKKTAEGHGGFFSPRKKVVPQISPFSRKNDFLETQPSEEPLQIRAREKKRRKEESEKKASSRLP